MILYIGLAAAVILVAAYILEHKLPRYEGLFFGILMCAAVVALICLVTSLIFVLTASNNAISLREQYYTLKQEVAIAEYLGDTVTQYELSQKIVKYNIQLAQYKTDMEKLLFYNLYTDKVSDLELIEYTFIPTPSTNIIS